MPAPRLPKFRLGLRTMMILVAVAALACAFVRPYHEWVVGFQDYGVQIGRIRVGFVRQEQGKDTQYAFYAKFRAEAAWLRPETDLPETSRIPESYPRSVW